MFVACLAVAFVVVLGALLLAVLGVVLGSRIALKTAEFGLAFRHSVLLT